MRYHVRTLAHVSDATPAWLYPTPASRVVGWNGQTDDQGQARARASVTWDHALRGSVVEVVDTETACVVYRIDHRGQCVLNAIPCGPHDAQGEPEPLT